MTLSSAATIVLTRAAERADHRLEFHRKLPTGGRHKMIDALLRDGLIAETLGDYRLGDGSTLIEDATTGLMLTTLRVTSAGLATAGREAAPEANTAAYAATDAMVAQEALAVTVGHDAATVALTAGTSFRPTLRQAAQGVLAAWDGEANCETGSIAALDGPMDTLRALLAGRAPRASTGTPRTPRTGTKQEAVLALLRRTEGASGPQIAKATGWAAHTVRGFLAGLKKKGFTIETLDRVRMVGSDKEGSTGSYSIYRIVFLAAD